MTRFKKFSSADRDEFRELLIDNAKLPYEVDQLNLFPEGDEDGIRREVERKLYDPQLPCAGDRERSFVKRFRALAEEKEWVGSRQAFAAAAAWQRLLPDNPRHPGRYYVRHRVKEAKQVEWLQDLIEASARSRQWEHKWFWEMVLAGLPEGVSDFKLECLYILRKGDGSMVRLVRLRNLRGESSKLEPLDADSFHSPQHFRKWCLARGSFSWQGGQKEIEKLHEDVNNSVAWREVNEAVSCGWLPLESAWEDGLPRLSGLWFFHECAYAPGGGCLLPDEDGIYWHNRIGYQLAEEGRENAFFQKRPRMQPATRVGEAALNLAGGDIEAVDEDSRLRAFYRMFNQRLLRSVGGVEAYLLIGCTLAFGAAPEIFELRSGFPGLFVHGQMSSGKSTVVEWMMECWGFNKMANGLILTGRNVTAVGMMQACDQYSNLPVWAEEYSENLVEDDKKSVLHNGFNRGGQAKFNPSRVQRVMRTNFIVSGESTSARAAIRSRFPHVQISATRRLGTPAEQKENYEWFNRHRQYFYFFGRYVMEHRDEFTRRTLEYLLHIEWGDERTRTVLGTGYAAWLALAEMMENTFTPEEVWEFREWSALYALSTLEDVMSETNINVFWTDLITAYKAGEIDDHCFFVRSRRIDYPPGAPEQAQGLAGESIGWVSYELLLDPDLTLSQLGMYLTKRRETVRLKRKDLRDQMSMNAYWIKGKPRARFTPGGGGGTTAWGIRLDDHPMGYLPVDGKKFAEYLRNQSAGDPRQGPLYTIINMLEESRRKREREKG